MQLMEAGRPASTAAELDMAGLHSSLEDPALESMNFLNEVASRYPDAVSFASGRPYEEFFDIALIHQYIDSFCDYLRNELGYSEPRLSQVLFQYGRTKGIMHELVARHLAVDEGIHVDPEAVVVTVGCQEAMFIVLRALRRDDRDVLLAISPTYVGLTGAARLVDMPVWPVRSGPSGVDLDDLAEQAVQARAAGLRPRACYVMPDFANPSGVSLNTELRHRLLEVAGQLDLLLLEDNPYGTFGDGASLPTLKALDAGGRVVYLGSFAKTGFPGARVGYAVADQRVKAGNGTVSLLADELSKIKSMVSVNTSPVAQAVVGGKLLESGCSMIEANVRETAVYVSNLRRVLDGLARRFPPSAPSAQSALSLSASSALSAEAGPPVSAQSAPSAQSASSALSAEAGPPVSAQPAAPPVPPAPLAPPAPSTLSAPSAQAGPPVSARPAAPAAPLVPAPPDADISWNAPGGGFFVVVTLPFVADDSLLEYSARQHGVLWTPMSHFYGEGGGTRQARLAFSQLAPEQIEVGLDRFAALVADARHASFGDSSATAASGV